MSDTLTCRECGAQITHVDPHPQHAVMPQFHGVTIARPCGCMLKDAAEYPKLTKEERLALCDPRAIPGGLVAEFAHPDCATCKGKGVQLRPMAFPVPKGKRRVGQPKKITQNVEQACDCALKRCKKEWDRQKGLA